MIPKFLLLFAPRLSLSRIERFILVITLQSTYQDLGHNLHRKLQKL